MKQETVNALLTCMSLPPLGKVGGKYYPKTNKDRVLHLFYEARNVWHHPDVLELSYTLGEIETRGALAGQYCLVSEGYIDTDEGLKYAFDILEHGVPDEPISLD